MAGLITARVQSGNELVGNSALPLPPPPPPEEDEEFPRGIQ